LRFSSLGSFNTMRRFDRVFTVSVSAGVGELVALAVLQKMYLLRLCFLFPNTDETMTATAHTRTRMEPKQLQTRCWRRKYRVLKRESRETRWRGARSCASALGSHSFGFVFLQPRNLAPFIVQFVLKLVHGGRLV
jgi:hypothetical protein